MQVSLRKATSPYLSFCWAGGCPLTVAGAEHSHGSTRTWITRPGSAGNRARLARHAAGVKADPRKSTTVLAAMCQL
jgi:hypothetical protein